MSIHKNKNKEKENEKINFSLLQNNSNSSNNQTTRNVLVINNALPNELYNNLEKEYISLKNLFSIKNEPRNILLSNFNYMIDSEIALRLSDDIITPLWKDFIKYHTSRYFINDIQKQNQNQLNQNQQIILTLNYMSPILYQSNTKINQMKSSFLGFFFMKNNQDNLKVNNLEIFENEKRIISIPYQKNTFIIIKNPNENNITFGFTEKNLSISSMKYIKFMI
jgi:hypothetical protein